VTLGIRPEHIDVAPDKGMLTVTVDLVEQLGGETYIYASAPGLPQITLRQDGQSHSHRGDAIAIRFAPDHLHIFDETGAALARP
jgi:multiple sugar transport system ATP-binding protein